LIGLKVVTEDGKLFGKILTVHNFSGDDVLEITIAENQKSEMFSFTKEIFPEVNIKKGEVVIVPPEFEFVTGDDEQE
jgi:16S rRNA processing protein RimM